MSAPLAPGCREAVARLWDAVDGELDAAERAALDRHLAWCLRCCGELEFARELREMLAQRSAADPPADVRARLEAFVDHLADGSGVVER